MKSDFIFKRNIKANYKYLSTYYTILTIYFVLVINVWTTEPFRKNNHSRTSVPESTNSNVKKLDEVNFS